MYPVCYYDYGANFLLFFKLMNLEEYLTYEPPRPWSYLTANMGSKTL